MKLALAVLNDSEPREIEVSSMVFEREFNESLIHQVVTAYLAGGRSGTRAQKTRAEVRGGGIKPWKQKGTGRARAGTIRSPLWRKGGRIFAAKPQDHAQKVNKKMHRAAIQSILSELVRQNRLIVSDRFYVEQPKTRELLKQLDHFGLKEALIVIRDSDMNLYLSARNLPGVEICEARHVDPVTLIKYEKIIMTMDALRQLEEVFA